MPGKRSNFTTLSLTKLLSHEKCEIIGIVKEKKDWDSSEFSIPGGVEYPVIYVSLHNKFVSEQCDLFDLSNFFLNVERVKAKLSTRKLSFILIVEENSVDNCFRVNTYLSLMMKYRSDIRVFPIVAGDNPRELNSIVENKDNDGLKKYLSKSKDYQVVAKEVPPDNIGRLLPLIRVYDKEEQNSNTLEQDSVPLLAFNSLHTGLNADLIRNLGNKDMNNEIHQGALGYLQEALINIFLKLIDQLTGTKEYNQNDSFKEQKDKLISIVCSKIENMTFLSQIIWLMSLLSLANEKALICPEGCKTWKEKCKEKSTIFQLQEILVMEYQRNALVYAEGCYQLLENSCQHTERKMAFFSIAAYCTDVKASASSINEVASTRLDMVNKMRMNGVRKPSFYPDPNVMYYFGIRILDDAYDWEKQCSIGMVEKYNTNNPDKVKVQNLHDLFIRVNNIEKGVAGIDETIYHYGLRLFHNECLKSLGCFSVKSPSIFADDQSKQHEVLVSDYYQCSKYDEFEYRKFEHGYFANPIRYTQYDIILPIHNYKHQEQEDTRKHYSRYSYSIKEYCERKMKNEGAILCFGILENDEWHLDFSRTDRISRSNEKHIPYPFQFGLSTERKKSIVEKTVDSLAIQLLDNYVYLIDITSLDPLELEVFAKALFKFIGNNYKTTTEWLLALLFANDEMIMAFIRTFALMFDDNGEQMVLQNTQIALCKLNPDSLIPTLCTQLVGRNLNSVSNYAYISAYFEPERSLEIIPHLRYLTKYPYKSSTESINPFPFELCMKTSIMEDKTSKEIIPEVNPRYDCWALRSVLNAVQKERNDKTLGCKIPNSRTWLHSGVLLHDYYNAELLFNNAEIISYLSIIIARDIFQKNNKEQGKLLLVGYEKYSSLLLQRITTHLLTLYDNIDIHTCIVETDNGGLNIRTLYGTENKKYSNERIVIITPIGTTLSTIGLISDEVSKRFSGEFWTKDRFLGVYLLLLVGTDKTGEHWTYKDNEIIIQKIGLSVNDQTSIDKKCYNVQYFLHIEDEWEELDSTSNNENKKESYSYVDTTSVLPRFVFTEKALSGYKSNLYEHEKPVLLDLSKYMQYGHIMSGRNHYRYYFNFGPFIKEHRIEIEKWAELFKESISSNQFNIIISPREDSGSQLLSIIIDKCFGYHAHVINIDVYSTITSDFCMKYGYIGYMVDEMNKKSPDTDIKVYFVSDSVSSGETLRRALKLVQALFTVKPIDKFDGVFTLVSRCRKESIKSIVRKEEHYESYISIGIPNLNPPPEVCPICKVERRYKSMTNQSTTNAVAQYAHLLLDGLRLRTPKEQRQWQKKQIYISNHYFIWAAQWLYYRNKERALDDHEGELYNSMVQFVEHKTRTTRIDSLDTVEELFSKREGLTISMLEDSTKDNTVRLVLSKLLPEKNYYRVIAANDVHVELYKRIKRRKEELCRDKDFDQEKACYDSIIDVIAERVKSENSAYSRTEWLNTFLLALVREHVSDYYRARQATVLLLSNLMKGILENCSLNRDPYYSAYSDQKNHMEIFDLLKAQYNNAKNVPTVSRNKADINRALQIYCGESKALLSSILVCVIECIAELQVPVLMNVHEIGEVNQWYENIYKSILSNGLEREKLCEYLPSQKTVEAIMTHYIKWSSISEDVVQKAKMIKEIGVEDED